jgi:hypothetical protein
VKGRIVRADDDVVVIDVDGAQRELHYDALQTGKVEVEFSRAGGDE